MTSQPGTARSPDFPIGRVELLGLALHVVEHAGQLTGVGTDTPGAVAVTLSTRSVGRKNRRRLMRAAINRLFQAAATTLADTPGPRPPNARRCTCASYPTTIFQFEPEDGSKVQIRGSEVGADSRLLNTEN